MIIEHSIVDIDPKGENGGTQHRILIQFDYRLVEMLESEAPAERLLAILNKHFDSMRKTIILP